MTEEAGNPDIGGEKLPDWLSEEWKRIDQRRARRDPPIPSITRGEPIVGLALSGGGIRSATFCLGLLHAMGRAMLIPRLDYLSTVSGGGYIGSFLCSLHVPGCARGEQRDGAEFDHKIPDDPFSDDRGREALDHLRQSGRHLMTGAGDAIRLASIALRNWLSIHFVIGLVFLFLFLLLKPIKAAVLQWDWYLDQEALQLASNGWPPVTWPSQWLQGYPFAHWFIASPLWLIAAFFLAMASVCGSGYWLTLRRQGLSKARKWRIFSTSGFAAFVSAAVGSYLIFEPMWLKSAWLTAAWKGARVIGILIVFLAVGAILSYLAAQFVDSRTNRSNKLGVVQEIEEDRVRHLLSLWMGKMMSAMLGSAAFALLDSIALTLYLRIDELALRMTQGGLSLAIIIPLIRSAYRALQGKSGKYSALLARFGTLIALVVASLLAAAVGIFWAVIAHALAWRGGPAGYLTEWDIPTSHAILALVAIIGVLFVANLLVAVSWEFLNLSTFASFYSGRLRRAYLGASNRGRFWSHDEEPANFPANADHHNDDVAIEKYYEKSVDAPLHLINVTINTTMGTASNLTQRDRRGRPLVVSSAGYLYPKGALGGDCERIGHDKGEQLPLSSWVGISGAAFSTGVGQHGSLGLSLLAGLANLRLGYWWDARPTQKTAFWDLKNWLRQNVQTMLRRELLGRFSGSDEKRWYLSDGGHFENTGVYELVRRRAGLIIAADCGADPKYLFEDVTRLMRLIRIDLDAHLEFLDTDQLNALFGKNSNIRTAFASLEGLGLNHHGGGAPQIGPYAAVGRIIYLNPTPEQPQKESTLLLIKPRVCGNEMPDLLAYRASHPQFPQETTADQFFDEAQWESYFRLGELIGDHVFRKEEDYDEPALWLPRDLEPLLVTQEKLGKWLYRLAVQYSEKSGRKPDPAADDRILSMCVDAAGRIIKLDQEDERTRQIENAAKIICNLVELAIEEASKTEKEQPGCLDADSFEIARKRFLPSVPVSLQWIFPT